MFTDPEVVINSWKALMQDGLTIGDACEALTMHAGDLLEAAFIGEVISQAVSQTTTAQKPGLPEITAESLVSDTPLQCYYWLYSIERGESVVAYMPKFGELLSLGPESYVPVTTISDDFWEQYRIWGPLLWPDIKETE